MQNPVLKKATEHFRDRLDEKMRSYYVKAWDATVYFKSTNSFKDEAKILTLHQQNKTTEALVESLIVKSRNADGSKMFQPADRVTLLNEVDPSVIIEVAGAISNSQDDYEFNVEEAAKN
jgi:hypothetical protein